jgi:hypothetical protein
VKAAPFVDAIEKALSGAVSDVARRQAAILVAHFEALTAFCGPGRPFDYQGGGHFRLAGVPKGKVAETVHGNEVFELLGHVACAIALDVGQRSTL